jgi:hypothetical protein
MYPHWLQVLRRRLNVAAVPGDGDCLFGAILRAMQAVSPSQGAAAQTARGLRFAVAARTTDLARRTALLRGDWGGSEDLAVIAGLLGRVILVFNEDSSVTAVDIVSPDGQCTVAVLDDTCACPALPPLPSPPLCIRHCCSHFDALVATQLTKTSVTT